MNYIEILEKRLGLVLLETGTANVYAVSGGALPNTEEAVAQLLEACHTDGSPGVLELAEPKAGAFTDGKLLLRVNESGEYVNQLAIRDNAAVFNDGIIVSLDVAEGTVTRLPT